MLIALDCKIIQEARATLRIIKSGRGNLPMNEGAFTKKYQEWENRDWRKWLEKNLVFPFIVERKEDDDDAYFTDIAKHAPFRLGHKMKVLKVILEDDFYGIIVKVREKGRVGSVSLCDVEVTPKADQNFGFVREYVVWFANR
ncbi:MAG: hypothetical protein HY920_06880 [Elusimicrobia bacterium]|nr:hypothetical protein [Elusimicrobiota bacterium]